MEDWYCYQDKVKMTATQVSLRYMQLVQFIPGLKCPVCGVAYLTENIVMTTVKAAEDALEEK